MKSLLYVSVLFSLTVRLRAQNVIYRRYYHGDDMSLIGGQAKGFCEDNFCSVAVDAASPGQKSVVGVVQMVIPAKHLGPKDRKAILAHVSGSSHTRQLLSSIKKILGHIYFVKVASNWQRKGIAKNLLAETFREIGRTEPRVVAMFLHVTSDNPAAIALYEKSKFTKIRNLSPTHFLYARYDFT
ncbi:hypothetical protein FOZ62_027305 [Perkinsus olseni]|uniref:N-acetyltransferase domain-containing protein n=1 Tax=Perkinsus olseni TaxID=32597 RepID=A0A7J6RHA6_PEROL|nr:hypothetical protein FOZ62_027305 [Perkinsus olseni]